VFYQFNFTTKQAITPNPGKTYLRGFLLAARAAAGRAMGTRGQLTLPQKVLHTPQSKTPAKKQTVPAF